MHDDIEREVREGYGEMSVNSDLFTYLAAEFESAQSDREWFEKSCARSRAAMACGRTEWARELDNMDNELAAILAGEDAAP